MWKKYGKLVKITTKFGIFKVKETVEYLDNFYPVGDFYDLVDSDILKLLKVEKNEILYQSNNNDIVGIAFGKGTTLEYVDGKNNTYIVHYDNNPKIKVPYRECMDVEILKLCN